jgi:hypothetical protein
VAEAQSAQILALEEIGDSAEDCVGRELLTTDPMDQFWSPYSYVGGSPLDGADPAGLETVTDNQSWVSNDAGALNGQSHISSGTFTLSDFGYDFGGAAMPDNTSISIPSGFSPVIASTMSAFVIPGNATILPEVAAQRRDYRALQNTMASYEADKVGLENDIGPALLAASLVSRAGAGLTESVLAKISSRRAAAIEQYASAHLTNSGVSVLGRYAPPPGYKSYIQKASSMGASYFDMGKKWTPKLGKAANIRFLEIIASRGDKVLLSVPKSLILSGSSLDMEIQQLTGSLNYRWVNQWSLAPR